MPVDIILGLQWGDEGKGKIVDLLAKNYEIVARFQGGPNAGHTLVINGKKYVFHTLPSGVVHPGILNIIGSGMVIDPITLKNEIENLEKESLYVKEKLLISLNAHLILPSHKLLDAAHEETKGLDKIGSTLKGIGPSYTDKMARIGLRVFDILSDSFKAKYQKLKDYHLKILGQVSNSATEVNDEEWFEAIDFIKTLKLTNTETFLNKKINEESRILAEGAQGSLLDVSFGTYPYVTSSNTISAAACIGLGIPPKNIGKIIGIFKAYCTRVGEGPFPTELNGEVGEQIRSYGNEYGSTTGRPRRCGWLDLVALKYACMINGVNELVITKSDVLSPIDKINVCHLYNNGNQVSDYSEINGELQNIKPVYESFSSWKDDITELKNFNELPVNFKEFVTYIENKVSVPVTIISTGPDRSQAIWK